MSVCLVQVGKTIHRSRKGAGRAYGCLSLGLGPSPWSPPSPTACPPRASHFAVPLPRYTPVPPLLDGASHPHPPPESGPTPILALRVGRGCQGSLGLASWPEPAQRDCRGARLGHCPRKGEGARLAGYLRGHWLGWRAAALPQAGVKTRPLMGIRWA